MKGKRIHMLARLIAVVLLASLVLAEPVYAKDYTGRLKECLRTDPIYTGTLLSTLSSAHSSDASGFSAAYKGKNVVLSRNLKVYSFTADHTSMVVRDNYDNRCTVDISGTQAAADMQGITFGDEVVIYGKVSVTGVVNVVYEIVADRVVKGNTWITPGKKVMYPNEDFNWVIMNDLTSDKRVKYRLPMTWNDNYVMADLTNNGVKGYQFYLNALAPQNSQYPEVFYIFYFNNETYLDQVPAEPSTGDYKKIEKEIIKNILQPLDEDSSITVDTFETASGTEIHYCTTTYRPRDGRDYRLEFMFRPEPKGITCMLYLYFPKEEAVHHVREVAYFVDTMIITE